MLPGQDSVLVYTVMTGAVVELNVSRNGTTFTTNQVCVDDVCRVPVPAAIGVLSAQDEVMAFQKMCRREQGGSANWRTVQSCENSSPPAFDPPSVGDTQIHVWSRAKGGSIRVFASDKANPNSAMTSLQQIGLAFDSDVVTLDRPISATDRWIVVAQYDLGCSPNLGNAFPINQ